MKRLKNWQRYALEWSVLAALILVISGILQIGTHPDLEAYCPFGGIQALVNYISHHSLPCGMSSVQIFTGIALIASVVLFSKLFCAYLCPLGTSCDLLMKLRKKLKIKPLSISFDGILDKLLRSIKYILLFLIIYTTIGTGELYCKRFDPYYAIATGFKGEISIYLSIGMLSILLCFSFFVDNFWCRYICPLGALSNTLKYWLWMITLLGVVYIASSISGQVPAWIIIILFCLMGYLFEVFVPKASMQILNVQRNNTKCTDCKKCEEKCPYHIHITKFNETVESVDCMLCGECIENCPSESLYIGFIKTGTQKKVYRFLPATITIVLTISALLLGLKIEVPTINEYWGLNNDEIHEIQSGSLTSLASFTLEGLSQVRCYASSKTFLKSLQQIDGVKGVKTYVKKHRATILYKPELTSPENIQHELFKPTKFQISRPDLKSTPKLRDITIRTRKMTQSNAVNLLGLQFKQLDSLIYGLEAEWDDPMIVRLFVHPNFTRDEIWIKEVVTKPYLVLNNARTGKSTQMAMGYEYVKMEQLDTTISTIEFLHRMFKPFVANFKSNDEFALGSYCLYRIPDENIAKPIIMRSIPLFASYLSTQDGIGEVYTCLNDDCVPEICIKFVHPMTEEKLKKLLTAERWTVRATDGPRSIAAPVKFKNGYIQTYSEQ